MILGQVGLILYLFGRVSAALAGSQVTIPVEYRNTSVLFLCQVGDCVECDDGCEGGWKQSLDCKLDPPVDIPLDLHPAKFQPCSILDSSEEERTNKGMLDLLKFELYNILLGLAAGAGIWWRKRVQQRLDYERVQQRLN
jgi:hypothetical protein